MAPEKSPNFKNMNISHIALKNVIWRLRICNYFCKISKFRDFINTLRNFAKSAFAHISAKFKSCRFKMIYNMFIFLKFEFFFWSHCVAFEGHFGKIARS